MSAAKSVATKVGDALATTTVQWLRKNLWVLPGLGAALLTIVDPHRFQLHDVNIKWVIQAALAVVGGVALSSWPPKLPHRPERLASLVASALMTFGITALLLFFLEKLQTGGVPRLAMLIAAGAAWVSARRTVRWADPPAGNQRDILQLDATERKWITGRRKAAGLPAAPTGRDDDRLGLVLSGGGVRAAAVSLGFVKRLADRKIFRRADYLSTVSGGGFFGGALVAAMAQPGRAKGLRDGDTQPWKDLHDGLRCESGYLDLVGPKGQRRIGWMARTIASGIVANVVVALFIIFLTNTLLYVLDFDIELITPDAKVGLEWALSLAHAILPERWWGVFLDGIDGVELKALFGPKGPTPYLMLPALGLGTAAGVTSLVALAAPLAGENTGYFVRRTASILRRWAMAAFVVGGFAVGSVLLTAGTVFWFVVVVLDAVKLPRKLRARRLVALVVVTLLWLVSPGAYDSATVCWQCAYAKVAFGTTNLVLKGSFVYVACEAGHAATYTTASPTGAAIDPPPGVQKDGKADTSAADAAFGFAVRTSLYAFPVGLCAFIGFGYWAHRNRTSLHGFWKAQIEKAFLSRWGLNVGGWSLDDLCGDLEAATDRPPLPIFNGAVNTPGSDRRERREAGAVRFEMSPCFVGGPATGWVPTRYYQGSITLSEAVSLSAAAVNTEGGTAIPGLLGALLIVLNIRLGSWLANPRYLDEEGSLPRRPLFAPLFLLREWLRTNSEDDPAVFVSDGGHEDNLGLSALVERGCPLVICLDATADAAGTFKDLNTAIRCLSLRGWALKVEKGGESPWLALVAKPGEIVLNTTVTLDFEHATSPATSRVIYTRSNLTVEASKDARAYQKTNAAFPQDSTADQWFDKLQFDAYVAVGEGLAEHVTARVKLELELARKRREEAQKDKVA